MIQIPKFVDTKTFIINLMREEGSRVLTTDRLQNFLNCLYKKLYDLNRLKDYQITYDVNPGYMIRLAEYNSSIFSLGIDNETIYLKNPALLNKDSSEYVLDEALKYCVEEYVREHPLREL